MKIDLEHPFKNDYKYGYLVIDKEPRRLVILVDFENKRSSISYARYLMSCHIGEYVDKNYEVDHIDNNKLNDDINNLQLLSKLDNIRKSHIIAKTLTLNCPICGKEFIIAERNYKCKIKNNIIPTCSRTCGHKKSVITAKNNRDLKNNQNLD